ncbi:MAG: hypothetical protein U9R25_19040 [Chloroflexota bacterium]|nr:hypothetical protein [Chloroflexota bacterium]
MSAAKKKNTLEYDWDPRKSVVIRNVGDKNILLDLPTGQFRLDIGRSFRMTPEVADLPQVKELIAAGAIELDE